MRHDDCGPDCDREFEDLLGEAHAQARLEVEQHYRLLADVQRELPGGAYATDGWRAILFPPPEPPARAG